VIDCQSQLKLEEIASLARSIGWGAADILESFYQSNDLRIKHKKEGPVTAADLAANDYILQQLRVAVGSGDFCFISEETYKSPEEGSHTPVEKPWVWIIDPIDGTRDFINRTSEYAIHIALVREGRPVLAVVVLPEAGKLYWAQLGAGAFVEKRDGKCTQLRVSDRSRLEDLCVVSRRTIRGERLNELLHRLPCQNQQYFGSIGCKFAAIAETRADGYISLSGKSAPKDWDLAAPELILTEAGGRLTRADGTLLMYNQGDVSQWGCLVASNGHCHEELCARVTAIMAQMEG
jgi:3'(2'), 5'-bisphosphate nucleotidase